MLRYPYLNLKRTFSEAKAKDGSFSFALLAWWSFLIALVTGALLAFHYRPWGDVFRGVSHLTGVIPYGSFLRTLHYLSGQCFLVFTLAHTLEFFVKARYEDAPPKAWGKLILLLSVAFLLLFTGFILKGDKEGIHAASVMYYLAQEVPFIGGGVARLFLRPGEELFLLPYLYHVIILPLLVLFFLSQHRKRILPRGDLGWPFLAFLSCLALVYRIPPDIPPHTELATPTGPWFFQGVQLLLRYAPPLFAGVLWPLLPLGLMAALPLVPSPHMRWARLATAGSWGVHGMFILLAWWLIPRLGP
ncbi:MAG: hypothetical protein AMK69_28755 [Nitrospira bacterium SG8_3]|nr:MAG: hypothetical protein AMK69_28755 [Nitrospira bacterium SG8_3]